MPSLITDQVLAMRGTIRPLRTGFASPHHIRQFAAAVDHLDPLYLDAAAARAAGYADVIAPPLFPQAATRPVPLRAQLLGDGQFDDLAPPGLEHLQSMLAGQDWTFGRPVVAGERLVEEVSIGRIEKREGRTGALVFVDEISSVTSETGDPILRSVNHLVFRAPPPKSDAYVSVAGLAGSAPCAMTEWDGDRLIKRPDMISLFMFDAAIWGVHRIHWDADYARSEGLPAPILPGWMMAAYLCEFVGGIASGRRLSSLSLKYRAFGHAGDTLSCTGSIGRSGAVSLVNQAGVTVLEGTAEVLD